MTVHIQLTGEQERAIREHGEAGYPYEIVGVMLGRDDGTDRVCTELVRMENTKEENRERRYTIDPLALARIERDADARGLMVLGFYHTHPDHPSRPSPTDLEWAWPFYSYIILSVEKGRSALLTSWRLADDEKSFIEEDVRVR